MSKSHLKLFILESFITWSKIVGNNSKKYNYEKFTLQETYDLQTSDLANGLVSLNSSSIFEATYKLDKYDLGQIGAQATNRGWVDSGLEWLELALKVR
jgi:hypothetical protein